MRTKLAFSTLLMWLLAFLIHGQLFANNETHTGKNTEDVLIQHLSMLNHNKLQQVFGTQKDLFRDYNPTSLYQCLCANGRKTAGASVGVSLFYHPEPLGKYNENYWCTSYGPPCIASGLGCWRFPLPKDKDVWERCIGVKDEHNRTLADVLKKNKELRKRVEDAYESQRLAEWRKRHKRTYFEIPSDVKDYDKFLNKYMLALSLKHYPTKRMRAINAKIRRHIMRLKTPGKLPDFLTTLGLKSPPKEDIKSLEAWRRTILKKYDKLFLRKLKTQNPKIIYGAMRKFAHAVSRYDQAIAYETDAALDEISANQTLVKDILESTPVAGDVLDTIAVMGYLGEQMGLVDSRNWTLNGDQVTALDAMFRFAGLAGPHAVEHLMKNSATARNIVEGVKEMTAKLGSRGKNALKNALGYTGEKLSAAGKKIWMKTPESIKKGWEVIENVLAKKEHRIVRQLKDEVKEAERIFLKSGDGMQSLARHTKDFEEAKRLIKRLETAEEGSKEFKELVKKLQQNKSAQHVINLDGVPDKLRESVNKEIKKWYKSVDKTSARDMKKLLTAGEDEVEHLAKKLNLDPDEARKFRKKVKDFCKKNGIGIDEVDIEPMTITNRRPGAKKKVSVGRDRDVTYQIKKMDKQGNVVAAMDVDHTISQGVYEKNFYEHFHGGDLPDDPSKIHKWVHEQMDQTVTSKWHLEAYNPGEVQLNDFLDKGITPTLTRVEDVADTVAYKSQVWFERAAKSADPVSAARNTREGMRQAVKQWNDIILSHAEKYGLKSYNIPPKLQTAMDVFKRVANGEMTAEAGEHVLKKVLNVSKEDVVRQMSGFLEGMEKTVGRNYRKIEGKRVENMVKKMFHSVDPKSAEKALETLNDALRNGKITGEKFMDLRHKIISQTLEKIKDPVVKKELRNKWLQRRLISRSELKSTNE